jgi:RimJ/RimL family protein N-acetyltransferase
MTAPLADWTPPPRPDGRTPLAGRFVTLEPLAPGHAPALHAANAVDDAIWDWLPYGPFPSETAYQAWIDGMAVSDDPRFFALSDPATGTPGGVMSYLRITPAAGSIEIGHICLSPALQRKPAATEAVFMMADWAFRAGYRRFEWKCNALNLPSRRAAQRFGFSFEGIFRNHMVVKGRNRDSAWFAMTDGDWDCLRPAYETWLDPSNFDADAQQKSRLGDLTAPCRAASDPDL